jgi:excisionase family DNA binding protein
MYFFLRGGKMADEIAISVLEAARRLGLSPRTVWEFVLRGELRSRKFGRRRIILIRDLETFLRRDHALPPASGTRQ